MTEHALQPLANKLGVGVAGDGASTMTCTDEFQRADELLAAYNLTDPEFAETHSIGVKPEWFTTPILQAFVGHTLDIYRDSGSVSLPLVEQAMRDEGRHDPMEFDALHAEIVEFHKYPCRHSAPVALANIRDRYILEKVQREQIRMGREATEPGASLQSTLSELRAVLDDAEAAAPIQSQGVSLADLLKIDISVRAEQVIKTGFDWFDLMMPGGGLSLGSTIGASAPPGEGKTSLCTQLTLGALDTNPNLHAVFATAEMLPEDLGERILSYASGLPTDILKAPISIEQEEMKRKGYEDLRSIGDRLHFINIKITPKTIEAEIVRTRSKWLVVDYLQIISPNENLNNRRDNVDSIVRDLVSMAKRRKVVLFIISNMPKPPGGQAKHSSMYGAFKESSEIPHAVDIAFTLEREESSGVLDESRYNPVFVKFRCWKMRSGNPRNFMMEFDGARQTFTGVNQ